MTATAGCRVQLVSWGSTEQQGKALLGPLSVRTAILHKGSTSPGICPMWIVTWLPHMGTSESRFFVGEGKEKGCSEEQPAGGQ